MKEKSTVNKTSTLQKSSRLEDVTAKYFAAATPNSHEVQDLFTYVVCGTAYAVDGNTVVLDYTSQEKEIAELLEKELGGEIFMVPRINHPPGISTPDYLFRGMRFDLKRLFGCGKNTLYDAVAKKASQSENFIFDLTHCPLDEAEINRQIMLIYRSTHTRFVDTIIMVRDGAITCILKRVEKQS